MMTKNQLMAERNECYASLMLSLHLLVLHHHRMTKTPQEVLKR